MARRKPLPIDSETLHRWTKAGILQLVNPGSGRRHVIPDSERRAIRAADSVRRLAGATPNETAGYPSPVRSLMIAAAVAARSNPPGTVVELPSPSPDVRHILIVPEPYPTPSKGGTR